MLRASVKVYTKNPLQVIDAYVNGISVDDVFNRIDEMANLFGTEQLVRFSKHMILLGTDIIGIQPIEIKDMNTIDYKTVWDVWG